MSSKQLPWEYTPVYKASGALPSFDELPKDSDGLRKAWKVWGDGDQLGGINLLTPDVVAAASKEIKTGQCFSLNLPLQVPAQPSFHRREPEHKLLDNHAPWPVRDDELHINTQSGSQWDGLRHFGCCQQKVFYGGLSTDKVPPVTLDTKDPLSIKPEDIKLGMHNWAMHTITGRAVLIDMVSWYEKTQGKLPYNPCTTHAVPLKDIQACAKDQGVQFKQGDILLIRFGWTQHYWKSTAEERAKWGTPGEEHFAGIERTEEVKAWIWNNHFAAVASDQPAFEAWPPALESGQEQPEFLHETIIGSFGMPIGEFFDLERLSEACKKEGRYTFFFASNPLCILGGAASTANASAIL